MTTRAPASPIALSTSIASIAASRFRAVVCGDDDALARGEAVGLHDDRRAALRDVGVRRARVGERAVVRRRNAVAQP